MNGEIMRRVRTVHAACRREALMVAIVESTCGGLISASLAREPGASSVMDRSWVTYSMPSRVEMLGADEGTFVAHGSVSAAAVREMARAALLSLPEIARHRRIVVAESGIAGPAPEGCSKPGGISHVAACTVTAAGELRYRHASHVFDGVDRTEDQEAMAAFALDMVLDVLEHPVLPHPFQQADGRACAACGDVRASSIHDEGRRPKAVQP